MMKLTWVRRIRPKEDWMMEEDDGLDMSAKKKIERRLDAEEEEDDGMDMSANKKTKRRLDEGGRS